MTPERKKFEEDVSKVIKLFAGYDMHANAPGTIGDKVRISVRGKVRLAERIVRALTGSTELDLESY